MDEIITAYVGLDWHAESTAIAVADAGRAAPRFVGTVGPKLPELRKALEKLGRPEQLQIVYEAGPGGFTCGAAVAPRGLSLRGGGTLKNAELEHWRMRALVRALMTLRGVDTLVATTLVAELVELTRFAHPRDLMGYLGLVPSEHSSGQKRSQGEITKTGSSHARRMLVEAAWNYRFPPRLSESLQKRQEQQPAAVRDIAWRAQLRLNHRYRRLTARSLQHNKVCVAIARELAGFVWNIGQHVTIGG